MTNSMPEPAHAWLVLLETSGNQRYIFDTNKRRENVGASQQIWAVGGAWLADALDECGLVPRQDFSRWDSVSALTLVAASGKVLAVVGSKVSAHELVQVMTLRAVTEAPGLDLAGVVGPINNVNNGGEIMPLDLNADSLSDAVAEIHRAFQGARARRPGPELRFQRLPIATPCTSSGLPAAVVRRIGDAYEERSAPSAAKLDAASPAMQRLAALLGLDPREKIWRPAINLLLKRLEGDTDGSRARGSADSAPIRSVAVIHADGNGLGALFLGLPSLEGDGTPLQRAQQYATLLRDLSAAVDHASAWAFQEALAAIRSGAGVPDVLPLVLGGDDLTVVCDAQVALPFTVAYLRAFERFAKHTHDDEVLVVAAGVITTCTTKVQATGGLSACAGVAISKPHHPFTMAYAFAEELLASAKRVKKIVHGVAAPDATHTPVPCSALDVHVIMDSAPTELERVRLQRTVLTDQGRAELFARPIVVTPHARLTGLPPDVARWVETRHWDRLIARAAVVGKRTGGRWAGVPRSQLYELCSLAASTPAAAEGRFDELLKRYADDRLSPLGERDRDGTAHLFWQEPDLSAPEESSSLSVSAIADVLELLEYLSGSAALDNHTTSTIASTTTPDAT